MTFYWNCDRNGCFIHTESPDWGLFDDCFPGRIKIGDGDGQVERNTHFLYFEWKRLDVAVKKGQTILYERRVTDGISTVFWIFGPRDLPQELEVWTPHGRSARFSADVELVRAAIRSWVTAVERGRFDEWCRGVLERKAA